MNARRNAEREFLDSLRDMAAGLTPIERGPARIGIPVGEARELDPADLAPHELEALFGPASGDTIAGGL